MVASRIIGPVTKLATTHAMRQDSRKALPDRCVKPCTIGNMLTACGGSMRPANILSFCMMVVLIGLLPNPPSAAAGWEIITLDAGYSPSLAINPLNQNPYISYYGATAKDLKLAFPVSSAGDCGPGNTWSCNSIQYTNTVDFGLGSSIGFDSAGNWGISYLTNNSSGLGFHGTAPSGNFQYYKTIETSYSYFVTSFRYSASGVASFAYVAFDGISSYLRFAHYNPRGASTCGLANQWDCETVAKVDGHGLSSASLAYMNDLAVIAYRDSVYGRLYTAVRTGFGNGTCMSSQWECKIVDSNSQVSGTPSVGAYSTSKVGIAYYDFYNHYMMVADATTGVCGWTCIYVESVNAKQNDNAAIAIALLNGQYIVAYTDRTNSNNTVLKVAYPYSGRAGDRAANCNYDGIKKSFGWHCEVIDDGGGTKKVGQSISMGVTTAGAVYIAYSNDSDRTIKLAYQAAPVKPKPDLTPILMLLLD